MPVPKNRWNGLVYLHGLLSNEQTQNNVDQLVLSSGDFGLAYLSEAWAARFVAELFRNFIVCFVGYSINDPVLRYMTDALAADKVLGESPSEMFAFGSFSKGKELEQENEWKAKNVTPILYRHYRHHFYLHKTLRIWGEMYRDGVQGKEQVVVRLAGAIPVSSTQQDDLVSRMLWALSDPSGRPAKRFAENDQVPSIDWLGPLSENRYGHSDLSLFGVPPIDTVDNELSFSFLQRPTPYKLAPEMAMVNPASSGQLDKVMYHLARWLTRHLNDPKLVLWVVERGGQVHYKFRQLIEREIDRLAGLEQDGKHQELDGVRRTAPNAVPSPLMRTLWRLVLSGQLKSTGDEFGLYRWVKRFRQDGLTLFLRIELRELLTPRVVIRKRLRWPDEQGETAEPQHIENLVNWEIVLATDHVHRALRDLQSESKWEKVLPDLLSDFSLLLNDALDLMRELRGVEYRSVYSYDSQPSISRHPQNERFFDWTALIELTRDAWIAMAELDPTRARLVAEGWMQMPYPLFKRLSFFAAVQNNVIPPEQALDWLLTEEHWGLWSIETKREAIRLLVELAPQLDVTAMARLEFTILQGPPREMYRGDIDESSWRYDVWLRLAKAQDAGAVLGEAAQNRLNELTRRYPGWKLSADQRDEFATWMSSSHDTRKFVSTPQEQDELVEWLKQHPGTDPWQVDDWQKRCREDFPTVARTLIDLAQEEVWPKQRWGTALLAWTEEENLKDSWCRMAGFFADASNEFIQEVAHELILWLLEQARKFEGQEERFFGLIRRILEMEHPDLRRAREDDLVTQAFNHPIGSVTEVLMRWWYRRSLQDGEGLPKEIRSSLVDLCDTGIEKFRHGRVILATNLLALYRVDECWTTEHLLPSFDWQHSEAEARAVWQGFLLSPRLYWPLMKILKKPFLDTAKHYFKLGRYRKQYGTLLAFAALDRHDTFNQGELAKATRALPQEGLDYVAIRLVIALDGARQQHGEYWKNRILPFLESSWPAETTNLSSSISESFAELSIAAGDAFPEALRRLKPWLKFSLPKVERELRGSRIIPKLYESQLCNSFPDDSLTLLETLEFDFGDEIFPNDKLACCLKAIRISNPSLIEEPRFRKLEALCRVA